MTKPQYFKSFRVEMLDFIPNRAAHILEVGCGEGLFGHEIATRQQAEVWGVEPNEAAAAIASSRLHKVVVKPFDDRIALPRNYFDCIIFNDVLEHMENPWQALSFSKSLLKSRESVVVASIPNFRNWHNLIHVVVKGDFQYSEEGILDKTHLRFFTEKSIRDFFLKGGFEILKFSGINPTESKLFKGVNLVFMNALRDMRFMQFSVVARLMR